MLAIYVDAKMMKKGIGTKLMNGVLISLKGFGFKSTTLWILESNTKGSIFMKKGLGFGWQNKNWKSNNVFFNEVRYKIDLSN